MNADATVYQVCALLATLKLIGIIFIYIEYVAEVQFVTISLPLLVAVDRQKWCQWVLLAKGFPDTSQCPSLSLVEMSILAQQDPWCTSGLDWCARLRKCACKRHNTFSFHLTWSVRIKNEQKSMTKTTTTTTTKRSQQLRIVGAYKRLFHCSVFKTASLYQTYLLFSSSVFVLCIQDFV